MSMPRSADEWLADLLGLANTRYDAGMDTPEDLQTRLDKLADAVHELDQAMREGATVNRWVRPVIKQAPAFVSFTPWTDGFAVGFRVRHRVTGAVEYVYLNPSTGGNEFTDEHFGTVFLYAGPHGDPAQDKALSHLDALRGPQPGDHQLPDGQPTREDRAVAAGLVRRARAAASDDERDEVVDAVAREIASERSLGGQPAGTAVEAAGIDLLTLSDELADLVAAHGRRISDDGLDDLTHQVAAHLADLAKRDGEQLDSTTAHQLLQELADSTTTEDEGSSPA